MLAYPITLERDSGALLATSPDFPELTTFGEDEEDALARAVHALEEAIAARIHDRKDIPSPSEGSRFAILPPLTSVKAVLYQVMREQGIGKAELARRLGWHMPQVDRVLNVQHRSRLDQLDVALQAVGCRLLVKVDILPDPGPRDALLNTFRSWANDLDVIERRHITFRRVLSTSAAQENPPVAEEQVR